MIKNLIKKTPFYRWYRNDKIERAHKKEEEKNRKIRGPLMAKYLPKHGVGAELGVLKGDFSRTLLDFSEAKILHLVDPWYFLGPEWTWIDDNKSTVDAVCRVLQKNRTEINNGRIIVHVQDDLKVLEDLPNNYFDWAYIDSSHAYEHTKQELLLLEKKVKKDGIICGDDWRPDPTHRHHGVYKAVQEFIKEFHYEILYADETNLQWFIKKK